MIETQERPDMLDALTSRLDRLEAMEEIRAGLHRYARAVDRCDVELLKTCYHADAIDVHWIYVGNAMTFCDYIIPEMAAARMVRHCITNPIIELDGDRAFVESQYWCVMRVDLPDKGPGVYAERDAFGRYLDTWEKRNGAWKIAHRHLTDDGTTNKIVTDQPVPVFNQLRTAQHFPNDPVYRGFDLKRVCPAPARTDNFVEAIRAAS